MMATKISSDISPDTMSRKMNRASTLPAVLEACCGHNGKLVNIFRAIQLRVSQGCGFVIPRFAGRDLLQTDEDENQSAEEQNRDAAAELQHVADDCAVFSGGRIVVIAVEENLIDRIADLAFGSLDQAHTEVFRGKFYPVEVARDAALRSEDHDRCGVRVLVLGGVVLILKADGFGERVD